MHENYLAIITIGGVQGFIEESRKMGDLWAGSHWIAETMAEIGQRLKEFDADILFPTTATQGESRYRIVVPNRIVVIFKNTDVIKVEEKIEAVKKQVSENNKRVLDRIEYLEVKAKRLAKDQLEYVFELSYAIEPLGTRPLVEIMAESERTLYKKKREFDKAYADSGEEGISCPVCQKRTVLTNQPFLATDTIGQMKRRISETWSAHWEAINERQPIIVKENEALCGVCLAKRERIRAISEGNRVSFYFQSVDNVGEDEDKYYALLMMDGDGIGTLLKTELNKGEKSYRNISKSMGEFALLDVREVLGKGQKEEGQLIYAGGDDVMAFLPLKRALHVAKELRFKFSDRLTGNTASIGLVIAHKRQPLRHVLQAARDLEKVAKSFKHHNKQKKRLAIRTFIRSGEPAQAVLSFGRKEEDFENEILKAFKKVQLMPRSFFYKLEQSLSVGDLSEEQIIEAELVRLLRRSLGNTYHDSFKQCFLSLYERCANDDSTKSDQLQQWLALLKSLLFIARQCEIEEVKGQ